MKTVECSRCGLRQYVSIAWTVNGRAVCRACRSPLGYSIVAVPLRFTSGPASQGQARISESIGTVLRQLRRRQSKTQGWVAEQVGSHHSEVSRAETGARSLSGSKLARILLALGVEGIYIRIRDMH